MGSTKEFLIKTVYDEAGMKRFEQDCATAKNAAKQLGTAFSDSAKVIDQTIGVSINRAGQQVRTVTSIFEQHGKTAKVAFTEVGGVVKSTAASFQSFGSITSSLGGELSKLVSRAILVVPIWELLRFGLKSLEDTFKESVKFMIEWEDQMAHIRAVTGGTKEEMDVLSQALLQISATFGVSNKALAESANQWLRNGANIKTVIPLLEATSKLSLLSGSSMEDAAKSLNAIMSGFKLSASETSLAVDKLTAVEEKSGVSLEVLSAAMVKTASTAKGLGLSFDQVAGFIAAINDKTKQSGDLIGSELRSIFLRLGTTAIDTAQSISKVPFFLDALGNTTTEHTPKLRALNSIITELSLSFKNLSNAQQDQLAKAVGGNLRANAVSALFSNFDVSIKAQAESAFGLKDAGRAIEDLTGTAKNHIAQLQGAWGQFVESFQQTGVIKDTLDLLKTGLQGVSAVIDPDKFALNKALEGIQKGQQESGKKFDQNLNLLKTIDQLHEMNDIFSKNIPGSIEKSVLVAATFRKVFEDAGIQIKGTFKDSFDLEKILTSQKSDFLTNAITASLTGKKDEIKKAFVENSQNLAQVIKNNTDKVTNTPGQTAFDAEAPLEGIVDRLVKFQKLTGADVDFIKTHLVPGLSSEQGQAVIKLVDDIVGKDKQLADIDKERASTLDEITTKQKDQGNFVATQAQVQSQLKDIQNNGLLIEEDKLVTIQKQLDLLARSNIEGNVTLVNEQDTLELKKSKLQAERELLNVNLQQAAVIARLKADGASQLQLDIQQLAFLKAQDNPDKDKVAKAESQVKIAAFQQEKQLQDDLISALVEKQKVEGESNVNIIQHKIDLEDQLGIHKQGNDLLKEQLELYKAITEENKKTKKDRLDSLQDLIKKSPNKSSLSLSNNNDISDSFRESSLRAQASRKGISDETINNLLTPSKASGGDNSLQDELRRGLSDPLTTSMSSLAEKISALTNAIVEQQKAPLTNNFPTFKTPGSSVVTDAQKRPEASPGQTSAANDGLNHVVQIGNITFDIAGSSPEEIAKNAGKLLTDLIASHIVKPGTAVNKSVKQVLKDF